MIQAKSDGFEVKCAKCKNLMLIDRFYDENTKMVFMILRCDECNNTQVFVRVSDLMSKYKIKNETLIKDNKPFTIVDPSNPYKMIQVIEVGDVYEQKK